MSTQFPGTHSVQVYERDADLIESVTAMLAASISLGDAALVVATPEHRDRIARALESLGVEIARFAAEGRYVAIDASQMLSSVMLNGRPDRELFDLHFASAIEDVRHRAHNRNRGLTIYGECVALLWNERRKEAALALEAFWEDVFRADRSFHLHCAYPRAAFADPAEMQLIHGLHSRVLQHSRAETSAA